MAMPPVTPITNEKGNYSYFQYLTQLAMPILLNEGISLNFSGYTDTINNYKKLGIMEWKKAMELSKEINAWSEYLSETANLIQKVYLDLELKSGERQALVSISYDAENVSNGNRLAYQDKEMLEVQKSKNVIKALYDELISKVRFLERAFYHCKSIGESGHKSAFNIRENVIIRKDLAKENINMVPNEDER